MGFLKQSTVTVYGNQDQIADQVNWERQHPSQAEATTLYYIEKEPPT